VSAYITDSRVGLSDEGYAVTCFDGSIGLVKTDGPIGEVLLVLEDGSTEVWETADEAIRSLIGEPR
jgi:hypothetical protein